MGIHRGHFAYYLTSQVTAIGRAMRASHKTVDRLLSGFPDPGWGMLLWKVAEVILRSTSSSQFSQFSSSSSPSSSFFYSCRDSQIQGVAREGGRVGENHFKINIIIIITSFIIQRWNLSVPSVPAAV